MIKKWIKETCTNEALKYNSRLEFKNKSGGAYNTSIKNGWINEICSHMKLFIKEIYWTKENCTKEALRYDSRSVFKKNSGGAYNASIKGGWLDDVCSHMSPSGNKFNRLVYVYRFSDNYVYVGLTYNIEERDDKHKRDKRSSVYKHIKKTGLIPELTFTEYMHVDKASRLESDTLEKYIKNGFFILNKAKTGIVGGNNLKWTFKRCLEEARECKTRKEFFNKNNSAYNSARRYKWLDKVCSHMETKKIKHKGYWTLEMSNKEALKYKTKKDFYLKSSGAYMSLFRLGLLNEACKHMNKKKIICQ